MTDPWAFGWTQLLTIAGFIITLGIAVGGFRTFGRWRREKLEERKIEVAFEALSLAYESKGVFETIRSRLASSGEWQDMPDVPGEDESERRRRGSYYVILKRIDFYKDFFERLWKVQPKLMAVFGPETEGIFAELFRARTEIVVSCEMLMWDLKDATRRTHKVRRLLSVSGDACCPYRRSRALHSSQQDKSDPSGGCLPTQLSPTLASGYAHESSLVFVPGSCVSSISSQAKGFSTETVL